MFNVVVRLQEDARLRQLVSTLGADNWDSVAKCISRRDAAQVGLRR